MPSCRPVRAVGLLVLVAAVAAALGAPLPAASTVAGQRATPRPADGLDPALERALRRAADEAAGAGVTFTINSGRRTAQEQERLLREAVETYGSPEEAARWVATPETSAHVSGDAVDLGPAEAAAWLSTHGAAYGLCRIYDNEPWHFELRPEAESGGCPPIFPDPTHDPRLQP